MKDEALKSLQKKLLPIFAIKPSIAGVQWGSKYASDDEFYKLYNLLSVLNLTLYCHMSTKRSHIGKQRFSF